MAAGLKDVFAWRSDCCVGPYSDWHNVELSATANYLLAENLPLTPSALYSTPISNAAQENIDSQWMGGVNLALVF